MLPPDGRLARRLFLLLLLLNSVLYVYLLLDRRMVLPHDTFQSYILGFNALSNAAATGEFPLWLPYQAHGTVSTLYAPTQGGMFLHALLGLAPLFRGASFQALFTLGMLVDELILLVGMWCLTRRLFESPYAAFFSTAAAVGTCVWTDQVQFTFRLYYAIPLAMALLRRFLEDGSRGPLALVSNLLALQFLCSGVYVALLSGYTLLLSALVPLCLDPAFRRRVRAAIRPRAADAAWVLVFLATPALVFLALRPGLGDVLFHSPGRNPDGSTSLDTFLRYGPAFDPLQLPDLLFDVLPGIDTALFSGALTLPLAGFALIARPGRAVLSMAVCALLLLFFSLGPLSFVATVTFYLAPSMHYFRHVGLCMPLVKLFLVLLAGYGFQEALRRPFRPASLCLSLILAALAIGAGAAYGLRVSPDARTHLLAAFVLLPLIAAAILRKPGALLTVHALGTFGWEIALYPLLTVPLDDRQTAMQCLQPPPYSVRRDGAYEFNERFRAFEPILRSRGVTYDVLDTHFFVDAPESPFRQTFWMNPLEDLALAAGAGPGTRRMGSRSRDLPALAKIIGRTEDKLQCFSSAHVTPRSAIARTLADPAFRGDLLLLEGNGGEALPDGGTERITVPTEVLQFDANSLTVRVRAPSTHPTPWLLYADCFHPGWSARVNGTEVRIEKAFLAYKAVPLRAGENHVEFRFRDPLREAVYRTVSVNALLWVAGILAATLRFAWKRPIQSIASPRAMG